MFICEASDVKTPAATAIDRLRAMEPRFPDGVRLERGRGGLDRLRLEASEGEAHVFLHGGHVSHFQPKGERPVLWLSEASRFEIGKPIRGGVPVCFPWFGPKAGVPEAPMHGFARILPWALLGVTREPSGRLEATLELTGEAAARGGFQQELGLTLALSVGRSLGLTLAVHNGSAAAARFEEALHSYFAVSDVTQVRVHGLEGTPYLDKTEAMTRKPGAAGPALISAETDRVYLDTTATVTIEDPGWKRRVVVAKTGSASTVLWNPWIAKARAMPDFGDDEWPRMLCVETANVGEQALTLATGATHVMTATLGVE
jgi:D-hexose-6-phosphate mutarotase